MVERWILRLRGGERMSLSEAQLQKKRENKKLKRKAKQKQKKAMIGLIQQLKSYQNKLLGQYYLNSSLRKQLDELVKKNNILIKELNKGGKSQCRKSSMPKFLSKIFTR